MTELLWKDVMGNNNTLHVMAVVIVLLMYYCYTNREAVKVIQQEHHVLMSEGFTNVYGKRLPQVQTGLGQDSSVSHGSIGSIGGGRDGFLGAYGPPVFYEVGDTNVNREYRSANTDHTMKYDSGRPMFKAAKNADGTTAYIPLPDGETAYVPFSERGAAVENMISDETLLARAQGFRSY